MKSILLILLVSVSSFCFSQTNSSTRYQQGYYKPSSGTYVPSHYKTTSNKTNTDNFSTSGNSNSYTGTKGYKAQDYSSQSSNYGSSNTIHTGSRGGQYYENNSGHKVYVPKR